MLEWQRLFRELKGHNVNKHEGLILLQQLKLEIVEAMCTIIFRNRFVLSCTIVGMLCITQ